MIVNDQCENLKRLDVKYGTDRNSPLHHDNRCECREPHESEICGCHAFEGVPGWRLCVNCWDGHPCKVCDESHADNGVEVC